VDRSRKSVSKHQTPADRVICYIQNQEAHHKEGTLLDEYRKMLQAFEVDYDEQHFFKDPE
jgi:hypothetical protein